MMEESKNTQKYYKVLNKERNHHGFQYKTGLNILIEKFNDDPTESCSSGGFYFTTKEHIHKFYDYGCYVYEVSLPDDVELKIVKDPENDKYRSNMIILGKYYDITNIDDIEYIINNISYDEYEYIIMYACMNGIIEVLEWFRNKDLEFKYIIEEIEYASENGQIEVLEWFKKNFYEFKITDLAINLASKTGKIEVLEWFKNIGLEFKYTSDAIDMACRNGKIEVLKWFKNSGLDFKYTSYAIDIACRNGNVEILEWFKNSGLEFRYTSSALAWASKNGQIEVLDWFKSNSSDLKILDEGCGMDMTSKKFDKLKYTWNQ